MGGTGIYAAFVLLAVACIMLAKQRAVKAFLLLITRYLGNESVGVRINVFRYASSI